MIEMTSTELIAIEGTTRMKIADIKNITEDKNIIQRCLITIYPPDRNVWSMEAYQRSLYVIVDKNTNELIDGTMGIGACQHFSPQNDMVPVWLVDRKQVYEIQARIAKEYNFNLNQEAETGMSRAAALVETVEGKPFLDFASYMKQCLRYKKDNGSTKITEEEVQFLAKFYEQAIDNSNMHIWINGEGEDQEHFRNNHIFNNNCHFKTILRESIKEFVTSVDGNMFDIVKANLLKYDLKDLADKHFCLICPIESNKILTPEIGEIHYLISKCMKQDEISHIPVFGDRAKLKETMNKMSEEDRIKFQQFQKDPTATNIRISKQDGKVTEMTEEEAEESFKEVWDHMSDEERHSLVARIIPEEKDYMLKNVSVREIKQKHTSMSFDYFCDTSVDGIKSYLLENANIASSLYLYTKSDQSVTTFVLTTESDNPARDIPKAGNTLMKSRWYDYYLIVTECWLKLHERSENRNYKPGEVTDLPRNEKKECLIFSGGSKQDGLKQIAYEIIREDPEDDESQILLFEKLDSQHIDHGVEK
jgi:hypothetical protein